MKIFTLSLIDQECKRKVAQDKCFPPCWNKKAAEQQRINYPIWRETPSNEENKVRQSHATALCIIHGLREAYETSSDSALSAVQDGLSICQKYEGLVRCWDARNSSGQHAWPAFTPALIAYDTLHKSITLTMLSPSSPLLSQSIFWGDSGRFPRR